MPSPQVTTEPQDKPDQPEYLTTSIKKIILLSLLTFGWYQLRWYFTNYHRLILGKLNLKSSITRALLTFIMYIVSIVSFLFLAYDIRRQAKALNINMWWHPLILYALSIIALLTSFPNSMPTLVAHYHLSFWSYLGFWLLFLTVATFIIAVLQQTVNRINQTRTLQFKPAYGFHPIHILAICVAPFLWFIVIQACYIRSLPRDEIAYYALHRGNYATALAILKPEAKQGNDKANLMLGYMYAKGFGVTKDNQIAEQYFQKALQGKKPSIQTLLANHYLSHGKQVATAITLLKQAAAQKFAPAMERLAILYAQGELVPSNLTLAMNYAQQAAAKKSRRGEFITAMLYQAKNKQKQQDWHFYQTNLKKSAAQHYPPAAYFLALDYRDGTHGFTMDEKKAMEWLQIAAKGGYPAAETALANAYQRGKGITKNLQKAVRLYEKAAERGDSVAQYYLGLSYARGFGVNQDFKQALNWFNQAAQKNEACAINQLGLMYTQGQGIAADDNAAKNYFIKAALAGFSATGSEFVPLHTERDLTTLRHTRNLGIHHISPQDYSHAYSIYMLSQYAKNKSNYQLQLKQLSPLALKEAKYLHQYFKLACKP